MRDVQYGSFAVKTLQIRSTSANHSSFNGGISNASVRSSIHQRAYRGAPRAPRSRHGVTGTGGAGSGSTRSGARRSRRHRLPRLAEHRALRRSASETAAIDVHRRRRHRQIPRQQPRRIHAAHPGRRALARRRRRRPQHLRARPRRRRSPRVRINGMEGAAQTGSSDIYGAGNNGRSFDFNVFPTEIFSQLAVRKTPSADVEEGSLGATVDLQARRARSTTTDDQVFSITGRGIYNDGQRGRRSARLDAVLEEILRRHLRRAGSRAPIQERHIREVGLFGGGHPLGTNANNIGTGRRADPPAVLHADRLDRHRPEPGARHARRDRRQLQRRAARRQSAHQRPRGVQDRLQPDRSGDPRCCRQPVPGSGAFFPRLPRYVNSEQDTERTGGTLTLQWRPDREHHVSLDGLMSRYQVERRDNYILGLSLGRNITNNGQPMVSIRDVDVRRQGLGADYGLFDGMDVRSEGLVDQFVSTFEQVNLDVEHQFTDNFKITATPAVRSPIGTARCACRPSSTPSTSTTSRSISAAARHAADRLRLRRLESGQLRLRADAGRQPDRARRLLLPGQAVAQRHGHQHVRARTATGR